MARPYWSGQLQISLVSFGIQLIPATEAKSEVHFHQIDRRTGQRVRHRKVSTEDEEPVEKGDIVKGYEYSKGEYIQFEPGEIDQLRIESRRTIDLEQFVPGDEIDPAFFEKPYFIVPGNASQAQAFAVVREALAETGRVGLGKFASAGRERLVAIAAPADRKIRCMMGYTLRFAEELRSAAEISEHQKEEKINPDELSLAKELIQRKSAAFAPEKFKDNYEAALRELIEARMKHIPVPEHHEREARGKVVNLMDALRRSVGEPTGKKKPPVRADGTPGKATGRQAGLKVVHPRGSTKRRKSA